MIFPLNFGVKTINKIPNFFWGVLLCHIWDKVKWKSILQVPDTGTQVLNNTRPFWRPVMFASGCNQHVLKNVNIRFSGNTGTLEILGHSSIWDLKYTFSKKKFVHAHSHFSHKDLHILNLSHLGSSASADQQQLFLTYSNLISSAKKLAQNLESLEATLSSTTSSQDSRLASL